MTRYADEPDPGPLLVCHRPPCVGRLYHDQVMHDYLSHHGPEPIDYARLERYVAGPERIAPVIRARPRRFPWWAFLAGGLLWVAFFVATAFVVAQLDGSAAPRSAPDPTAPQPGASEVTGSVGTPAQAQAGASGPEPSGAPLERERVANMGGLSPIDRDDGGAP